MSEAREYRFVIRTKSGRFIIKFGTSEEDAVARFREEKPQNQSEAIAKVTLLK